MENMLRDYQQGTGNVTTSEIWDIVEYIENNKEYCGTELYRGACTGETYEIGDTVRVGKKDIESWTEDLAVAEKFCKERGPEISAIFQLDEAEGIFLEDFDNEIEWLLEKATYTVVEIEEYDTYTVYVLGK